MKTSVCITVFNEEKTINKLLDSLLFQTKMPDEIVIVDGGSSDSTVSIISNFQKSIYKQFPNLKFQAIKNKRRISIAKGRNLGIKNAKYSIIAMSDAGCVCDKNWLERIIAPFEKKDAEVVAGFYKMTGKSDFQMALAPFLGTMADKFNEQTFLPSARSIAFKKSVWEKVGGFREKLDRAGEDTYFNIEIIKNNFNIVRTRNAIVRWEVPGDLITACKKFFYYAKGDAQIGGLTKHNIKVLTIFARYVIFLFFWPIFPIYLFWPIYKHRNYITSWRQRIYTVIIQVTSDFAVMAGFLSGIHNGIL